MPISFELYMVKYNHINEKGVKHYGGFGKKLMYAAVIGVVSVDAYFYYLVDCKICFTKILGGNQT